MPYIKGQHSGGYNKIRGVDLNLSLFLERGSYDLSRLGATALAEFAMALHDCYRRTANTL